MDCYCELMGVANPNDLPVVYPKQEDAPGISVGSVRVSKQDYKKGVLECKETHLLTMPHRFTNKEWAECAAFDFTADCCLCNGFHYSATVPTRYHWGQGGNYPVGTW